MSQTAFERIQAMQIGYSRRTADFYIGQANRLADILWEVIKALDVEPIASVNERLEEGDTLIFGMYRASDLIAAARRR